MMGADPTRVGCGLMAGSVSVGENGAKPPM